MTIRDRSYRDRVLSLIADLRSHRAHVQRRIYDVLVGQGLRTELEMEIDKRHQDLEQRQISRAHMDTSDNLLRFITRTTVDLFRSPVHLGFASDREAKQWRLFASPYNKQALGHGFELAFCCGTAFAMPNIDADDRISIRIIPAHQIAAEWLSADRLSMALYPLEGGQYVLIDEEMIRIIDDNARTISVEPHHISSSMRVGAKPICPVVPLRVSHPSSGQGFYSERDRDDLFESTVLVSVWATWQSVIAWYQSFLQLAKKREQSGGVLMPDVGAQKDAQKVGPAKWLEGDWYTIDLQSDIERLTKMIESKLRRIAVRYGISADHLVSGSFRSGVERVVSNHHLQERRSEIARWAYPAYARLIDIGRQLQPEVFSHAPVDVSFSPVQLVDDPSERLKIHEQKMRLGLASPVDYLIESGEAVTREEAMQLIEKYAAENARIQEMRQPVTPALVAHSQIGQEMQENKNLNDE